MPVRVVNMFFEITNIGKIKEARLDMRGMTVLAGHNSTGKSTVGKALYCIFNAFSESDKTIIQTRKSDIVDMLTRYTRLPFVPQGRIDKLTDRILAKINSFQEMQKIIQEAIGQDIIVPRTAEDSVEILLKKIRDYAEVSDKEIQKVILSRYLAAEFDEQITHVNQPKQKGKISLSFKNQKFNLVADIVGKECVEYVDSVGIMNRAFYADSPFIVDTIKSNVSRHYRTKYNHRHDVSRSFHLPSRSNNISEEVIGRQKLQFVMDRINLIIPGYFDKTESRRLGFREQGLDQPLELTNVSAGMKTLLIIKRLLETGAIKERDVLILDEPEIHLHPDWQLKFAEVLVLLQQAFNLTVLLTTHSPYFLEAVEVYSSRHGISDNYACYLTSKEGDCYVVNDVTQNMESVYKLLAEPFQELEDTRYE